MSYKDKLNKITVGTRIRWEVWISCGMKEPKRRSAAISRVYCVTYNSNKVVGGIRFDYRRCFELNLNRKVIGAGPTLSRVIGTLMDYGNQI